MLLWLAWDIGENAHSLLQLRKRDFTRQVDVDSDEPEYTVHLRREILKRSRTPRAEVTNYPDTVRYLDLILANIADDDLLFQFGTRMAAKLLERAVRITDATCIPGGQKVTLKDLRSPMACDLLSKGWTTDEVNFRLGQKPSSREIDKYVNWLALDKRHPKKRINEHKATGVTRSLAEAEQREKLTSARLGWYREENDQLRAEFTETKQLVRALQKAVGILHPKNVAV